MELINGLKLLMMKYIKLIFKEAAYGVRRSVCWLLGHPWLTVSSESVPARSMSEINNPEGREWEIELALYCPQCRTRKKIYLPHV